jgi:stearoyl-CoA desaturase (delta-9 desaturase)
MAAMAVDWPVKQTRVTATSGPDDPSERIPLLASLPFWGVHAACLLVIWSGVSWLALLVCALTYCARSFGITGVYHRYFSHRTFKMGRRMQFALATLGATALQKGPLWWAALHRHHHRHSDTPRDVHPPEKGFWWSHVGWILSSKYNATRFEAIPDFAKFRELRWLNKYHLVPPISLAVALFIAGALSNALFPQLGTSGLQLLTWGFFISTVLLWHGTFTINSLAHRLGKRRFATKDTSRNSWFLAIITLGEGWHNNHHRYPSSERNGFYWWELDVTHYLLKGMARLGVVWDLRTPPPYVYAEAEGATGQ